MLLHGAGDTEGYWFGINDRYLQYETDPSVFRDCYTNNPVGNITKNMLDYMIEHKIIKDTIVITPTFYDDVSQERMKTRIESSVISSVYRQEVEKYFLPAISEKFSTYATGNDASSLKAARDHFAYAGYSLGGIAGLTTIIPTCYDYFASYGIFSGNTGSLTDVISTINGSPNGIKYLYMGRGDKDEMIAIGAKTNYETLLSSCEKIMPANSAYTEVYDTAHFYDSFITQLYNSLPFMF